MKSLKQVWAAAQRSSYGVAIPAKQSGSEALPDGESAIAQFELRVVLHQNEAVILFYVKKYCLSNHA